MKKIYDFSNYHRLQYANEYAELWARMNKIFSIESVSFKK